MGQALQWRYPKVLCARAPRLDPHGSRLPYTWRKLLAPMWREETGELGGPPGPAVCSNGTTPLPPGSSARAAASPSWRGRRPPAGTTPWGWNGGVGSGTATPPANRPLVLGLRRRGGRLPTKSVICVTAAPSRALLAGRKIRGRRVGPGLLPRNGVHQAHPGPQLVDHGQDGEQAGFQGPRRPLLGDEGGVALGQARALFPRPLHLAQEVRQLAQQPVGEEAEVRQTPPIQPQRRGLQAGEPVAQAGAIKLRGNNGDAPYVVDVPTQEGHWVRLWVRRILAVDGAPGNLHEAIHLCHVGRGRAIRPVEESD